MDARWTASAARGSSSQRVRKCTLTSAFISGRCRDRTDDFLLVRQALYRLS